MTFIEHSTKKYYKVSTTIITILQIKLGYLPPPRGLVSAEAECELRSAHASRH